MRMATFVLISLTLLCSCAAKIGPGVDGWASWDVCGWEGGVSSEINIMGGNVWRLGCTDPKTEPVPEPDPEDPDE